MQSGTLNCAVIGLGKIGIMHAAMVRNIPGARLAALVDREPRLGSHVQSMMGTPVPFFTSVQEAIRQTPLQAAFVCTPQFAHRAVAETCLDAGLDVFVEKPLAHTLPEARSLMDALQRYPGTVTGVGFMKAHEGLYREVARLLREGAVGRVLRFEATCYLSQVFKPKKGWIYARQFSGGGMVINSTCHLLHSLQSWFGPVHAVTARCRSLYSTEVEDEASIQLEFATVSGQIETSWSQPGYDVETSTVRIQGEAGTLEVDDAGLTLNRDTEPSQRWPRAHFERAAFNLSPNYGGEGYYCEDEDFVHGCLERRPARVGWDEGLAVQRVIDAIYRSNGQRMLLECGGSTPLWMVGSVDDGEHPNIQSGVEPPHSKIQKG